MPAPVPGTSGSMGTTGLTVTIDAAELKKLENAMAAAGANAGKAVVRAVNHTGDKMRTRVIRDLTKQTGLKRKVIVKALKIKRASWGDPAYVMTTRGGDISLKYFAARETRRGVSAAPRGQRKVFPHTFMKGGLFPNRKALGMNGHVFKRAAGEGRWPIEVQKSGVFIPAEMVTGATAQAFQTIAAPMLADRVAHELYRIIGGAK